MKRPRPNPAPQAKTGADAQAVATYLKSLPPVDHPVPGPTSAALAPKPYASLKMPAGAAPPAPPPAS